MVRESKSHWSSLLTVARKPDGTTEICIYFRKVNNVSVKYSKLFPRIHEVLASFSNKKIFSTLDCMSSFHQIKEKMRKVSIFCWSISIV